MHDCSDMMESVPEKPDYRVVTNRHRLALELAARVEMLRIIRELGATRTLGREVRDGAEAKTMLHSQNKELVGHRELGRSRESSQPRASVGR